MFVKKSDEEKSFVAKFGVKSQAGSLSDKKTKVNQDTYILIPAFSSYHLLI